MRKGKVTIWDDLISESDLKVFEKGGFAKAAGLGKRPAVLVVNMTFGLLDERFPTGCASGLVAVKNIRRLLETARRKKVPIVYCISSGWAKPVGRNRCERVPDHTSAGSQEARQIWPELAPESEDVIIIKSKPSAFFGTDLVSVLNFWNVDTLIVTGMVTSGCIRATIVDAFSYNYYVIVPEECVADRGDVSHRISLFDIHMKYGSVLAISQVEEYLECLP